VQKTERNGQKEAGVRQESALDRKESRKVWERTGIAIGEIQAGKDMKGR
jgi:hypothetical protein